MFFPILMILVGLAGVVAMMIQNSWNRNYKAGLWKKAD
jgi:hypothetical protein